MKRILICFIALLISSMAFSQRANNWVFGVFGGFTYNSTPPSGFSSSLMINFDSSSTDIAPLFSTSMSDCQGNLLFYGTNKAVWNKYHQPMKNGDLPYTGDVGRSGVLAVPVPDSTGLYYYIASNPEGVGFLRYSIIDMSLANDSGAVVPGKEGIIFASNHIAGSMATTPHANGRDIWLITFNQSYANVEDSVSCFLITPTGITGPVTSYVPDDVTGYHAFFFALKPSPDGKKLVLTGVVSTANGTIAYLCDFDNSTGKVTNPKPLILPINTNYPLTGQGIEFSPDNKNIFITTSVYSNLPIKFTNYLLEYKRDDLNQKKILATYTPPNTWGCKQYFINSLQLGPDNKIYGAFSYGANGTCNINDTQMLVINKPNEWGNQAKLDYFKSSNTFTRIPYFYYTHYFVDIILSDELENGRCIKDTTQQIILKDDPGKYVNYTLYFGDGDSIIVTTPFTNGADTFYHYYSEGDYTIKVETVNAECNYTKAFEKDIEIKFKPQTNYSIKDSSACWEHHYAFKDSSLLTTSTKLLWGNGKTSTGLPNGSMAEYYATEDTFTYQYIAFNAQCSDTVSGQLISTFLPKPDVRLGITDTAFCQDESFILTDSNTDVTDRFVDWGDGTTNNLLQHTYTDTGEFQVFVTDTAANGCNATDSITLTSQDIKLITASGLTFDQACEDATMEYDYTFFNADSVIIDWGDGNYYRSDKFNDILNHTYTTGNYTFRLMTFNSQCLDTIFSKPVELLPDPVASANVDDNQLCEGQDITVNNTSTGASSYKVLWGDLAENTYPQGTTEFTHTYTTDNNLTIEVIAINAQNCADTTELDIDVLPLPVATFTTDADSGCRPLDLGIINNSTDYTTHFINWGDGSPQETGNIKNTFNHIYTDKGTYPITLGISNGYCADTAYGSIKVTGLSGVETSSVVVATVDGVKSIFIEWQPVQGANGYNLYRSVNGIDYILIQEKMKTTNYFDNISTEQHSWYYKVQGVDSCDNLSQESNIGRTIYLTGKVIGKNQAAMLNWNPYQTWQGGVLSYILEVQDEFGNFSTLTSQQDLTEQDTGFLDLTKEEKCYRIVAYELGGNNAVSTSNTVCLPYQPLLWAPNAFSPNGDGYNDTWGVMHVAMQKFSFTIYNRWGEKVFESSHPHDTWDGKDAPIGVYVYIINGKGINGKPYMQKGEIHLVR